LSSKGYHLVQPVHLLQNLTTIASAAADNLQDLQEAQLYRRGTARRAMSVEILLTAAQFY